MKYIVERLLTNAQHMDTDMVSGVEAKIESLKGKTIEVPLDFLYKLQEFLIASSCMHDEGMMKANYHTALLILHQSLGISVSQEETPTFRSGMMSSLIPCTQFILQCFILK